MRLALDRPIAILAGMAFVTQVGVSVMLPLLPLYAQSLGATPAVLGLLVSSFSVALAAGQLGSGFLAERLPARRLVIGGLGVYAAANGAIALATAAVQLIAFRAIAGLGAGINQVAERLYITRVADATRLAFANGVISAGGSAGSVMGPTIGGVLAAFADLRAPFVVVAVTSLAATAAGWFLPVPAARPVTPLASTPGRTGTGGESPGDGRSSAVAAPLVILFFVQLAFQTSFGAFITTFAPFGSERLGWSTAEIGVAFSLFGLGSVLLGPPLARLADRYGRRSFGVVGAALIFPFPFVFVLDVPPAVLYPVAVVGGAGVTTVEAAWFALLGAATDGGRRGRAFSTVVAVSSLGVALGATVASQLWERTGDAGLGMVFAAAAIGAAGLILLLHPPDSPATPDPSAASAE